MSINIETPGGGGGGTTDHSALSNLDYGGSAHTGFEASVPTGTASQFYRGDKTWQLVPDTGAGAGVVYAPTGATYIVQVASATLTNEQAIADLATGILKGTSGTGLVTIAVANTDYESPITTGTTTQIWHGDKTFSNVVSATTLSANVLTIATTTTSVDVAVTGSLIIPANTNPTLAVAGAISIDTSTGSNSQIRFYNTAEHALPSYFSKSFTIVSPTTASDYPIWRVPYAVTLKKYEVQCNGADNVVGALDIASAKAVTSTATSADVTAWNGSSTAATIVNASIPSGSYTNWHTTSISSTPLSVTVVFDYEVDTNVA